MENTDLLHLNTGRVWEESQVFDNGLPDLVYVLWGERDIIIRDLNTSQNLSGVVVVNLDTDVRMEGEVRRKVFKIL